MNEKICKEDLENYFDALTDLQTRIHHLRSRAYLIGGMSVKEKDGLAGFVSYAENDISEVKEYLERRYAIVFLEEEL